MATIDWYFDYISPFAYLQYRRLAEIPSAHTVRARPVLFAGLLQHWEHRGPAEIPPKRRFTYRYVTWYARTHGIDFRMPPAHPFNPLPALRLTLAMRCDLDFIGAIFRHVWADGRVPGEGDAWQAVSATHGIADPQAAAAAPAVKAALREQTEAAAAAGVFGVPTALVDGQLFWGVDATDMLLDYLRDPAAFLDPEMRRISDLPMAASRF